MPEEKIEYLINEFFELKKEITSGEVSIKRNYLLFKKYMLMITLYNHFEDEIYRLEEKSSKQAKISAIAAGILCLPVIIFSPAGFFIFIYCLYTLINKRKGEKAQIATLLSKTLLIQNTGEIIYNKLMKRLASLSDEEIDELEQDTNVERAEAVLNPEIYAMLRDVYQVDATAIGDVENEMIYSRERKQRKN